MNIEQAITYVRNQLKWKVVMRKGNEYEILSDPFTRTHTIYSSKELYGLSHEYAKLHELVHAYLGETVSILIATNIYTSGEKDFFSKYQFVHYITSDWFVDNYCIGLIGKDNYIKCNSWISTIRLNYHNLNLTEEVEDSKKLLIGYTLAILAKNEIEDISIHLRTINKVKKVLLSTPVEPTLDNYLTLINKLLKIVANEQVSVSNINNVETLIIAR